MDGSIFSNRLGHFVSSSFSVFLYCDYRNNTVCELLCEKTPIMGIGLFGSFSRFGGSGNQSSSNNSLNYYCMNCGTRHIQSACPKCGSKMKRVGS